MSFLKIYKVEKGDEIVLATDGYSKLYFSLNESERVLNELLKIDPLCYKELKGAKGVGESVLSFDDRAFIRFVV